MYKDPKRWSFMFESYILLTMEQLYEQETVSMKIFTYPITYRHLSKWTKLTFINDFDVNSPSFILELTCLPS